MKSKLGIILLWVLVFLLGGIAGAISQFLYHEHLQATAPPAPPKPFDPVEGMARALNLDATQKDSVKEIITEFRKQWHELNMEFAPQYKAINERYRPQFDAVNTIYRPRFEAIRNESDEKIKKVLNPQQRAKFEAFLKKFYAQQAATPQMPAGK